MAIRERKRVFLACIACRRRKIKCTSDEENNPCTRCIKKGILCEYLSIDEERERSERIAALDNGFAYSFPQPVWDSPHHPDSNVTQSSSSTQEGNSTYVSLLMSNTSPDAAMDEYAPHPENIGIPTEYHSHSVAPQGYNRDDLISTLPYSQYADSSQHNISCAYARTHTHLCRQGTVLSISAFSLGRAIAKAPQIRHTYDIYGIEPMESNLWTNC